jgi:hypothetical protein
VLGGHLAEVLDTVAAEQDHRPPLLDGPCAVGVQVLEVHDDPRAGPDGADRGDRRPRLDRLGQVVASVVAGGIGVRREQFEGDDGRVTGRAGAAGSAPPAQRSLGAASRRNVTEPTRTRQR